ncbi:MAG: hypothetical protein ACI4GC_06355 [Acutalibacteraceae bacterium]
MAKKTAFFLGANTPKGFVSFFDELYNPYTDTNTYIIKGGPGTGKSSFMKKLQKTFYEKGCDTECGFCASDPDSFDSLIVPEKGFAIADGTSPHVLEPKFPGCGENIVNLGQFWSEERLKADSEKIKALFVENSLYHRRSTGYLAAAGSLDRQTRKIVSAYTNTEKIDSFTTRFVMRELPKIKRGTIGKKSRRFLSAISPKGNIFLKNTLYTLCTRIIGIDDKHGEITGRLLERIGEAAIKNGYDVIFCHCPMKPDECEHLIIVQAGLAIIRLSGAAGDVDCDRVIHTSRFIYEDIKNSKNILNFNQRVKNELILESIRSLKMAKKVHDDLESYYIKAMDFDRLNEFAENFSKKAIC